MYPFKKCTTQCPRVFFGIVFLFSIALVIIALILQKALFLNPCPMCILQRFVFIAIAVLSLIAMISANRCWQRFWSLILVIAGLFGIYLSARQSWIQWYPPEFSSCGRDFYNILQSFPLSKAVPLVLKGTGECTQVDWSLFGLTMANYAFIAFVIITLFTFILFIRLCCSKNCSIKD